jgi:hypothetical protein
MSVNIRICNPTSNFFGETGKIVERVLDNLFHVQLDRIDMKHPIPFHTDELECHFG